MPEMRRSGVRLASSQQEQLTTGVEEENSRGHVDSESKRVRTGAGEVRIGNSAASSPSFSSENLTSSRSIAEWPPLRISSETEPVYATISVMGRSREKQDAVAVVTNLCRPEISKKSPVHFFGVYDGHDGPHVAALCRDMMHAILKEELMRVGSMPKSESGESSCSRAAKGFVNDVGDGDCVVVQWWKAALRQSFVRMDAEASTLGTRGTLAYQRGWCSVEVVIGGCSAVVSALTSEHIVVANCGDSRAVLCRSGRPIPLSHDHKPDRLDELARIEAAGGRVISENEPKVEGILPMSRAIGYKNLKPFVTPEPDVTVTKRSPCDECLIVATDGLWNAISSELACHVALKCLGEAGVAAAATTNTRLYDGPTMEDGNAETMHKSGSKLAAASLTRLALARNSSGNISVIVVDLKRRGEKKLSR